MSAEPRPSAELRDAVLALRGTAGVVGSPAAPQFAPEEGAWQVRFSLRVASTSDHVPAESNWCALVDPGYPFGRIRVYPAREGGLTGTFPHQEPNTDGKDRQRRRNGLLCLDHPLRSLGRLSPASEPLGDAETRLRWHVERALAWLEAAAEDGLVAAGERFELPKCETQANVPVIVHDEDTDTFAAWQRLPSDVAFGVVRFEAFERKADTRFAAAFETDGRDVRRSARTPGARREPKAAEGAPTGVWWRWPAPVVVPPWATPATWGDLRAAGTAVGVDVAATLPQIAALARRVKADVLLLGYPIPFRAGAPPAEMHWQAVALLELDPKGPHRGFRPGTANRQHHERAHCFGRTKVIQYVPTENWHPDRLQARGRLDASLCETPVATIGVGALGSAVAELLVRAGVMDLLLVDPQALETGNLVRHALTLDDVGRRKVEALAERLRAISPFVHVRTEATHLPTNPDDARELLAEYPLVLDCTGEDAALEALARVRSPTPKLLVSASVGLGARRLFLFCAAGASFPVDAFRRTLRPWLDYERRESPYVSPDDEVWEGAGCWSPLFPARYDDILLAAATTVKVIEELRIRPPKEPRLAVFEQTTGTDGFSGLRRIEPGSEPWNSATPATGSPAAS